MPKAIYLVPIEASNPVLPPFQSDDGYQLWYDDAGTLRGGYSLVGHVPQAPSCLVLVEASDAVLDLMAADARFVFMEDVVEEVADVE